MYYVVYDPGTKEVLFEGICPENMLELQKEEPTQEIVAADGAVELEVRKKDLKLKPRGDRVSRSAKLNNV